MICIEDQWAKKVADAIAETGKPVAGFSIERSGDLKTIEAASRKAKEFVHYATEIPREPFPRHVHEDGDDQPGLQHHEEKDQEPAQVALQMEVIDRIG